LAGQQSVNDYLHKMDDANDPLYWVAEYIK